MDLTKEIFIFIPFSSTQDSDTVKQLKLLFVDLCYWLGLS